MYEFGITNIYESFIVATKYKRTKNNNTTVAIIDSLPVISRWQVLSNMVFWIIDYRVILLNPYSVLDSV